MKKKPYYQIQFFTREPEKFLIPKDMEITDLRMLLVTEHFPFQIIKKQKSLLERISFGRMRK